MLRLKADSSKLSQNGSVPNDLFADISTRSLNSVIIGENCGKISQGAANAFIGFECGNQNTEGSFGVFIGYQAGQFNRNANWNTFVGSFTGRQNTRGEKNTFVGYRAGELNLDGAECVAIGANAMRENVAGNRNVAIGINAGERILEGNNNTMIGAESGQNIRSGNLNTMAGYRSGKGSFKGNENTYFGAYSGYSNEMGDGNAFIGYKSGEYLNTGNYNVGVGAYTLHFATEGDCNIAIGAFSGSSISGNANVLVGTGAAGNTNDGSYNTNIGTNAGYNANGDNNVYIGYEASKNTFGDKNVVIGSSAFSTNNSSNSVIIGYNTADRVFKAGSNNIFIGVGADAQTTQTSFAIAIGTENTRSGTKSISIGENLENSGYNSLLLGYDMYSDSDKCVSIGYKTQINNVIVFNDPLNYIFPLRKDIFNFQENYTDTIFMNGESNTNAIATINKRNIFDSGCNLLSGIVRPTDITFLEDNNIFYQNITILHTTTNTTPPFINIEPPPYDFSINNDMTRYNLNIPIEADSSNLIPTNATSINYEYVIGRRLTIDTFSFPTEYTFTETKLQDNFFLTNITLNSVTPVSFESINFFDKSLNRPIISGHPINGDIVLHNNTLSYNPYPEALFADTDTFSVAMVTHFDVHTVITEDIQDITINFTNKTYPQQTSINFHKDKETRIDGSYEILEMDPNLEFITPSNLKIISSNQPITTPLTFVGGKTLECSYFPTFQKALSYSNITFVTGTFSLDAIDIPYDIEYIVEYPIYGIIDDKKYTPMTFNFTKDTFKIFSNDTLFIIDVLTKNTELQTRNLNIFQQEAGFTYNSNIYQPFETTVIEQPIRTSVFNTLISNGIETTNQYSVVQTTPYEDRGYIHTSNTEITEMIIPITLSKYNGTITDDDMNYDYYTYRRDALRPNNPFRLIVEYDWDYTSENGFKGIGFEIEVGMGNQFYSNVNNEGSNRFFLIDYQSVITTVLYKQASNIIIHNSNIFYQNETYVDNYNNYIYTDTSEIVQPTLITSNITIVHPVDVPFTEMITNISYSNNTYITSNISTLMLTDTNFYKYEGVYETSSNMILQKDIGIVTSFVQSNVTNKEIHIFGNSSNLFLTDVELPINYYSNLENSIIITEQERADFKIGDYEFEDILIYSENIDFLNNTACVGDGAVLINYINAENKSIITQYVPSSYVELNTIYLNIGLTKVAKILKRSEVFFKNNSEEITYRITNPHPTIAFYKNGTDTLSFTQSDINNELITIEGTGGIEEVIVGITIENILYPLKINKYMNHAYLDQLSSNSTSNVIVQSNYSYNNYFMGSIWEDLDSRREDVSIHILNNPVTGFLYSSNSGNFITTIGYRDFKEEKIHYIPYNPMKLSPATFDIFFSYLNVASPIYSITIENEMNNDKSLENISQRLRFTNEIINIDVDQTSYTYFEKLLEEFPDRYVIFYILTPPSKGVILNDNFLSVSYFTSQDILENKIFYQNYKGDTTDTFTIKVGTNLYDLSLNTATVVLQLLPFPKLFTNDYDYIYSATLNDNYYPLDPNKLNVSFGGIYIYDTEYIDVFVKDTNGEYVPRNSFIKGEDVYYRPSTEFFQYGSNENVTMKMRFFTYNNSNITRPSPLAQIDIYKDIYTQEWFSKFNTFDSKNKIISDINPNQVISYTRPLKDELFRNKKCKIQFDYRPVQPLLDLIKFGDDYNDFLKTYKYSFKIVDFSENVIIQVDFENNSNVVIIGEQVIEIDGAAAVFDWNRFYIVNNDDTNDLKLSIYINDINYTDYVTNPVESIDLEYLKDIIISVPITDPKNNYTDTVVKPIGDVNLYYNFENYNTSMFFKNFQIQLGKTDLERETVDQEVTYNIAIGDYLRVNGYNNICIGKNFLTTGTGSIIIGNDIGSSPNTTSMLSLSFNEVFNSIIISTSSFIETKVRDVIAIGNNIFNNAGGAADIDLFFSKKPVLIGNDITTKTIDFHVNIQNSFLKTDIGYKQLYCGLEEEAVCIGYSSNVMCNNALSKLYVNGNVNVNGSVIERSFDSYRVRYTYPGRRFTIGAAHEYVFDIEWPNKSSDNEDIISLECKFKYIGTTYGYYNFESVIAAFTNTEIYSITHSIHGNITHRVDPRPRGIRITLNWNSASNKASMEVEAVCLNTLGNIVFA